MHSPFGKNIVLSCPHVHVAIKNIMLINSKFIAKSVFSQLDSDVWETVNMLLELTSIRSQNFVFTENNFVSSDSQLFGCVRCSALVRADQLVDVLSPSDLLFLSRKWFRLLLILV